jgi:membrane carboxypeptidase/penicillin-binding protein PbpC
MQCARNVFLWQDRTWVRKAFEAWFTVLLELAWSKRRILEVYLNVIEWGPGVYGAEAAAERYFALPAARLTTRQAALLAAALPSPLRSNPAAPSRSLESHAARIRARMARVDLGPLADASRHPLGAIRGAAGDRPALDPRAARVLLSAARSDGSCEEAVMAKGQVRKATTNKPKLSPKEKAKKKKEKAEKKTGGI